MGKKLIKTMRDRSLVNRIVIQFLFWITLSNAAALAGLWWVSHYLIEQNLRNEITQLVPELDNKGAPLYFSAPEVTAKLIQEYAKKIKDIEYIRYYDADFIIVGEYKKHSNSDIPLLSRKWEPYLKHIKQDPAILLDRSMGIIQSIRALTPIRSKTINEDAMLDLNPKLPSQLETSKTIGYMDLGMDLSPSREVIINCIIYGLIILGIILCLSLIIGWYRIRNALEPLVSLQTTLKRVASGDFNVTVDNYPSDREIAAISNAIRKTVKELRQRDLEKEEALRAKFSAEAANNAKSFFLANMSHEIRTPLHGLLGFLNLLMRTPLNREQREYLKTVNISAKTLLAIINDILDFSKIEAGKLLLEEIEMDLLEIAEDTAALHAATAAQKGLELLVNCSIATKVYVLGDPARVMQILSNLISNAIKFTENGAVIISLMLQEENDAELVVKFCVRDTGIGISKEVLEDLFEPFTQADSSTTRKYGGTGLGLVIVKKVLEVMGSQIIIQTNPGVGSSFSFFLKFKKTTSHFDKQNLDQIQLINILAVTANPWLGDSLRENFSSWNIPVQIASNVEDAISLLNLLELKNLSDTLIIVDANLPNSSQFPSCIKQVNAKSNYRFVLLDNLYSQCQLVHLHELGFHSHITKPIKSTDLYREMKTCKANQANKIFAKSLSITNIKAQHSYSEFRALIVDDNEINRRLAGLLLEKIGGTVNYSTNGEEAIDTYRKNRYDLILMDVYMPGMDGIEATRRIREIERKTGDHTPIIALTASPLHGDRQRFMAAGVDSYLTKPVTEKALLSTLAQWCEDISHIDDNTYNVDSSEYEVINRSVPDSKGSIEATLSQSELWNLELKVLVESLPAIIEAIRITHIQRNFCRLQQYTQNLAQAASYSGARALEITANTVETQCYLKEHKKLQQSIPLLIEEAERLISLSPSRMLPRDGEAAV